MKTIKIPLDKSAYEVYIGKNILSKLNKEIESRNLYKNIFMVVDKNVHGIYEDLIGKITGNKNTLYLFEANENLKTLDSLKEIFSNLMGNNFGRDSIIISIGGGIVGDVGGFAAATYMRGIEFIQVPTTLLAFVDSSVGGKTGVNFNNTKNIIGAFHQPKFVIIDINFLRTLSHSELLSGIGEIVKYAFITGGEFFDYLINNLEGIYSLDNKVMMHVISESVKLKADIVVGDEKESSIRKMLNLGHTFAHAFEAAQDYKIKHGHAVILGISCALCLSKKLNLIGKKAFEKSFEMINKFKTEISTGEFEKEKLYAAMQHDKKNREGKIKFVLIKNIGELVLDAEAGKEDVFFALDEGLKGFTA